MAKRVIDPKTYAKNVIKSAGYIGTRTVKGINPDLTSLLTTTSSDIKDMYQYTKNFKTNVKQKINEVLGESGYNDLKKVGRSALDDLKTGKFYNPERAASNTNEMMKSFGFNFDDLDFNVDEHYGEESSSSAESANSEKSMASLADKITSAQKGTSEFSTSRITKGARANTAAMMAFNQKLFGELNTSLSAINSSIMNLHQDFAEPLNGHITNSSKFYEVATTELSKQTSLLENMNNILTERFAPKKNGFDRKLSVFEQVFSGGFPNFRNWGKVAKDRLLSGSMIGMLPGFIDPSMLSMLLKTDEAASPVGTLLSLLFASRLKKGSIGKALSRTTNIFKGGFTQVAARISSYARQNKNRNKFTGFLAKLFDIAPNEKSKMDFSSYNKGRADWSGQDSRALQVVIPTQLAQILSALTGEEAKIYDYKTGKFVTTRKAIYNFKKGRKEAIGNSSIDLRTDIINQFIEEDKNNPAMAGKPLYTHDSRAVRNLSKDYDTLMSLFVLNGVDTAQFKKQGDIVRFCQKMGWLGSDNRQNSKPYFIDKKSVMIIDRMLFKNAGTIGRVTSAVYSGKVADNRYFQNASTEGTLASFAGSGIANSGKNNFAAQILNTLDDHGNNLFFYLQDFYTQLRKIASKASFGSASGNASKSSTRANSKNNSFAVPNNLNSRNPKSSKKTPSSTSNDLSDSDPEGREEWNPYTKSYEEGSSERRRTTSRATREKEEKSSWVSRIIDKFNGFLENVFFGNEAESLKNKYKENGGLFGLVKSIPKLVVNGSEELLKKVKNFFSSTWNKFKESGFGKEYFKNLKDTAKKFGKDTLEYGKEKAGKVFGALSGKAAPWEAEVSESGGPTAADGGYVKKSGMASVSEGEMIIPAKYNPFYRGKMSKSIRNSVEKKNYNAWKRATGSGSNFIGFYADGTIDASNVASKIKEKLASSDEETLSKEDKKLIKELEADGFGIEQIAKAMKKSVGAVGKFLRASKAQTKRWAKKKAESSEGFQKVKEVAKSSVDAVDNAIEHLFGDSEKYADVKGNVKEAYRAAKVNMPKTLAKGTIGALIAGAATGSGLGLLGGFAIGAGQEILKNSETLSRKLFGEEVVDDNGQRHWIKGKLPPSVSKFIKEKLPSAAKGGALGGIIGALGKSPGGILGGMILGSGIQLLSTTEKFKEIMFGPKDVSGKHRNGGLLGSLKVNVVDRLINFTKGGLDKIGKYITKNFLNPLKTLGTAVVDWTKGKVKSIGKTISDKVKEKVKSTVGQKLNKIIKPVTGAIGWVAKKGLKLAGGIASAPFRFVGNTLGGALEQHNIRRGFSSKTIEERMALEEQGTSTKGLLGLIGKGIRHIPGMKDSKFGTIRNNAYTKWAYGKSEDEIRAANEYLNGSNVNKRKARDTRQGLYNTITSSLEDGGLNDPKKLKEIKKLFNTDAVLKDNDFSEVEKYIKDSSDFGDETKASLLKEITKRRAEIGGYQNARADFDQKREEFLNSLVGPDGKPLSKRQRKKFIKTGRSQSDIDVAGFNKKRDAARLEEILAAKKKDDAAAKLKAQEQESPIDAKRNTLLTGILDVIKGIASHLGIKVKDDKEENGEASTPEKKKATDIVEDVLPTASEESSTEPDKKASKREARKQARAEKKKKRQEKRAAKKEEKKASDIVEETLPSSEEPIEDIEEEEVDEADTPKRPGIFRRIGHRIGNVGRGIKSKWNSLKNRVSSRVGKIKNAFHTAKIAAETAVESLPVVGAIKNFKNRMELKEEEKKNPLDGERNKLLGGLLNVTSALATINGIKVHKKGKYSAKATAKIKRLKIGLNKSTDELSEIESDVKDVRSSAPGTTSVKSNVPPSSNGKIDFITQTGQPIEFTRDSKGELQQNSSDASTKKYFDDLEEEKAEKRKFFGAFTGKGGLLSSIKGLFGKKDDETGEKKESLLSRIFGKVKNLFSGENSIFSKISNGIGGIFSAIGGSGGLLSVLITGLKTALPTILSSVGLGILLNKIGENAAGTSKDSGMYKGADAEARKEEVKNSGVITKIGLGADAIENTIRGRDTTTYNEDDHVTEYMSSRFKKRVIKNALTSFNPKLAKATSKVVNKTIGKIPLIGKGLALPLDAVGKGKNVAKFAKKIGDTKIFKAVAGSKAVQAAGKATGTVVTKIKDLFKRVLGWIAEKLGKKGGEEVIEQGAQEAAEAMAKKGGSKLAGALAKFSLTLQIITITNAFTVGLQNAGAKRILGILDTPTFVQRLLAAALNALNEAIPGIGGLIPTEVLFSIVYSLLKALGCDFGKLDEQRAQAKATVEAYNQEHGTTYNIEEYLANVLNEMTIQDRIKGGIKKGIKAVGNWVKGIFGGGSKTEEEDKKTTSNQPKVLNPSAIQENINKMNRSTQAAKASVNSIKPTATGGTRRVVNNKPFATSTNTPTAAQRNPGAPLAATGSGIFNFTGGGAEEEALSTSESAALTRISEDINTQTAGIQLTDNYISDLWKFSDPDTKIEEFNNTVKRYTTSIPDDSYSGKLMSTITGIMKMAVGIVRPIRNIIGTIGGDISAISDSIFNNTKSSSGGKGTFSYVTSRAKKYWDWSGDESNTGSGSDAPSTSVHTTQKGNFNKFGKTTIDKNGCGPAVAATVLKAYGKNADINSIANYAENNGYVAGSSGAGTRASYFSDILGKNGIGTSYENNTSKIKKAVSSGRPTILLGQDKSNKTKTKSPFGPNPHYVVARGTDRNGNVYVDDPELGTTALYKNNILNKAKLGVVTGRGTGIKRYPYTLGGDSDIETTFVPVTQNSGETQSSFTPEPLTPTMSKVSMMPQSSAVMNAATAKAAKDGILSNAALQENSTTGDSTEEESNKITDIGSLISAVLGKAFGAVSNKLEGTFAGKILRLIFGNFEQSEDSTAGAQTSTTETNPVNTVAVPEYDKAHAYDTSVGSITNHYGNDITGLKVATRLPSARHPYIEFYNNSNGAEGRGINKRPDGGSHSNPVKLADKTCNVVPSDIGWVSARFNHIYSYLTGYEGMRYPFLCTADYDEIKPLAIKNDLPISQFPQVGAIMLWTNERNSKANHVAIVEKVISDSRVVTSESSSTEKFYSKTREKSNGKWGSNTGTFEGFIYNPGVVYTAVTKNLIGNSYLVRDSQYSSRRKVTRTHNIDTIIIGSIPPVKSAKDALNGNMHPNYVIYPNGIGLLVDEKDVAWFPFNGYNDICNRSVSIAISPYDIFDTSAMESMSEKQAITSEMYNNLARLIADISIRNGIKEIVWNQSAKDYYPDYQNIYMEKMINKNIDPQTNMNDSIIADNLAKVVKEANAMIKSRRISAKNESITTGKNDKEKIWNFLKANGFTDIAAAAVMGNFQQESGNRANSIEGDYLNAFKKYGGAEKVMSSPETMHDYTENVLFPIYEKEGIPINKNAYKGRAGSKYANYYLPGFGLPGWTGPKASDLLEYADKNGEDWRKVETQLHFIQNDPNELIQRYKSTINRMNESSNVEEASKIFFHNYENPAMSLTSDLGKTQLRNRSNSAKTILGEFAKQAASGSGLLDFVRNQGGSSGNSITGYTGITKKDYSTGDDNLLDYINNYVNSQGFDTSNLDTGGMDESYASGTGMRKSSNRQMHTNQKVLPAFKHNQFGGSSGVKNSTYQQTTFIGGASSVEYTKQLENLILYIKQIAANTANNASMPVLVDVMTQAIELLSAIANKANAPASNSVASQDFTDGINNKINLMKAKLETIAQTL